MPASTLKRMAHRASVKYIRNLHDIGQMPIELVHTIINKIDNAAQLHQLELNSPQVVGHTKEAWLNLLKRDIPNYEARMPDANWRDTIFAVDNADRWHKVYAKLRRQVERESKEVNERLMGELRGVEMKQPIKISNSLKAASNSQQRNRKGWAEAKYDSNKDLYRGGGGGASAKASAGASFFEKLNRNAVTKASARMRTPTHKLKPVFNKEVKRAPMGLVEDLKERREILEGQRRIQADRERREKEGGADKAASTRAPRNTRDGKSAPPLHGPNPAKASGGQPYDLTQDREARLRNLKTGPSSTRQPSKQEIARLTEDFLEDDDDDDGGGEGGGGGGYADDNDDLFGESSSSSTTVHHRPTARTQPYAQAATASARRASPLKQSQGQRAETPPVLKKTRQAPTLFRSAVRK